METAPRSDGLMISFKKKFIFVHISKTGGSSVEHALRDFSHHKVSFEKNGNAVLTNKHWTIEQYSAAGVGLLNRLLGRRVNLDDFFKFCFVRNPWDRLSSNYEYFRSLDPQHEPTEFAYPTLKDWILGTPRKRKPGDSVVGTWADGYRKGFRNRPIKSQLSMILIDGQPRMDFIGRYERLQNDFDKICEAIGIEKRILPHKNRSSNADYKAAYDEETRDVVAQQYADDIEFFGYTF